MSQNERTFVPAIAAPVDCRMDRTYFAMLEEGDGMDEVAGTRWENGVTE